MVITEIREKLIAKAEEKGTLEMKPAVKCIISFIGGLLMMNPFVLGQFSPFSVSLICTLDRGFSVLAGAGGITGSFLFFSGTDTVKYAVVILFAVLLKSAAVRLIDTADKPHLNCVNAFVSMFFIGNAVMLATGFDGEEFLGIAYEALLAAGGTYIFRKTSLVIWSSQELSGYTTEEIISLLLTSGIMLMHFYRYSIGGISPVVLIFIAVILSAARIKNGYGGALCGICAGFTLGLSKDAGFVCVGLALGGLVCGELNRKSRILGAAGFAVSVFLCAAADGSMTAYMTVAESIIGCAVFLAVPEKFFSFLCEKVNSPVPVYIRTDDNRKLARKLNDASGAITRISDCVASVQHTLKPAADEQLKRAVRKAWDSVCRRCELNESCRSEVKTPTDETIEKLASALYNHAELDETKFPKNFYASCYSFTEMQTAIKEKYLDYTADRNAQGQVEQINRLMSDQFMSVADILHDLACEFDGEIRASSEAADRCADEAREFGLEVISADSYLDRFGRLSVSLNIQPPDENFNILKFTENLSSATGTQLDIPELVEQKDSATLVFSQKLMFSVSAGAFSRPAENENICGDYYRSFCDENGRYIVILSDGMGTGSRAAIDSAMAAELFSRLVRAGIGFDCALSISNSAMLVKSTDESLATLDILCIDRCTGKTEFMKAGAAATFVRHRGNVAQLEQASLPIGILRDIKFSKAAANLEKGDIVLMVSDGVLGENSGWIQQELKLWEKSDSPQSLAEFIVESACERKLSKHRDDMTAVAVYVE